MSTDNVLYRLVEKRPLENAEIDSNFRILVEEIERLDRLLKTVKGVVWSDTPPSDRSHPWLNEADMRIYYWNPTDGVWISKHPIPTNDARRFLWVGTEDSIKTIDDGEDAVESNITGPFWVPDTAFQGRVPVGAGKAKNGSGAEIANAFEWVSGSQGKDTVTAIPWHRHGYGVIKTGASSVAFSTIVGDNKALQSWNTALPAATATDKGQVFQQVTPKEVNAETPVTAGDAWTTEPVEPPDKTIDEDVKKADTNTIEQPGVGCFVLKRSNRAFHVAR